MPTRRVVAYLELSEWLREGDGVGPHVDSQLSFIIAPECVNGPLIRQYETVIVATGSFHYFLVLEGPHHFRRQPRSHICVAQLAIIVEACAEHLSTAHYEQSVVETAGDPGHVACHERRLLNWTEHNFISAAP